MQHITQKTKKYSQQQTATSVTPFTCHSWIRQLHGNGQNLHSFGTVNAEWKCNRNPQNRSHYNNNNYHHYHHQLLYSPSFWNLLSKSNLFFQRFKIFCYVIPCQWVTVPSILRRTTQSWKLQISHKIVKAMKIQYMECLIHYWHREGHELQNKFINAETRNYDNSTTICRAPPMLVLTQVPKLTTTTENSM